MLKKKLILLAAAMVFLTGFFLLPVNRTWVKRLITYYRELPGDLRRMDEATRFKRRFGTEYTYSRNIAARIKFRDQALILMPPTNYFTARGMKYHVPEAAVFYYFTRVKTVWANSPQAMEANWIVYVRNKRIVIDSVTDKKALQDSIAVFNKMGVSL